MYLEAQLYALGTVSSDAWGAVYDKAKDNNFGTSKQDINEYATVGGSVAAAGACVAMGAAAAAPLCAEVGGFIGGTVANLIQGFGSALFGGGDDPPTISEYWNPVADKAIAGVVKAVRAKKGLDSASPPGGSMRNYPEWQPVAEVWARNVNRATQMAGGKILFFDETGSNAGRVSSDGEAAANYCFFFGKQDGSLPQSAFDKKKQALCTSNNFAAKLACGLLTGNVKKDDTPGAVKLEVARLCANVTQMDAAKSQSYLPKAIIQGTQQTANELLSDEQPATGVSPLVVTAAVAGAGAVLWYFHQPILAFVQKALKG